MSAMLFTGCGDTNASVDEEAAVNTQQAFESDNIEEVSEPEQTESEIVTEQDAGPEENPYDGGPDWVTLADQFTLPTSQMCTCSMCFLIWEVKMAHLRRLITERHIFI